MILTGAGTDRPDQTGLDDVPALYNELASRLDRSATSGLELSRAPDHVFLTGVPNPLAATRRLCPAHRDLRLREQDQRPQRPWLSGTAFPTLNGAFSAAAGTRWTFVPTASAVPNGMCASGGTVFNRNRDALRAQGSNVAAFGAVASVSGGWVHPNSRGHEAMGPVLADAMQAKVISDFTPTVAPVSAPPAPVVDLLPRVELTMGDAGTSYDTRPAGQKTGEPTNAVGPASATRSSTCPSAKAARARCRRAVADRCRCSPRASPRAAVPCAT